MIINSQVHQMFHANRRQHDESTIHGCQQSIMVGDLVYLLTANLSLLAKRARKLVPRFIGPYPVAKSFPTTSTYELTLPATLAKRGIHPIFHLSLIRCHEPNDTTLFPHRDTQVYYDMGTDKAQEWLVDSILDHKWDKRVISFHVKWNLGDMSWELLEHVAEAEELDNYLDLYGMKDWHELPKPKANRAKTP